MPKVDENSLCFTNSVTLSSSAGKSTSKSRVPDVTAKVPRINSKTGIVESAEDPNLDERHHDSCFLMQTLRIGNSDCLVMFDRGSNINLINGTKHDGN